LRVVKPAARVGQAAPDNPRRFRCPCSPIAMSPAAAPALTAACEVLVIGAGRDVWLVDHQVFPRDKVCGDGRTPDVHAGLRCAA